VKRAVAVWLSDHGEPVFIVSGTLQQIFKLVCQLVEIFFAMMYGKGDTG